MTNLFIEWLSKAINHSCGLLQYFYLLQSIYYVESQCKTQKICTRPGFIDFHLIKVIDPIKKKPLAMGATQKSRDP